MPLQCNIAITNVQVDEETTLRVNIKKRLDYVRYGQKVPRSDIPLEYVAYDPITVGNTLFVADLSGEIPGNSQTYTYSFNSVVTYSASSFYSDSKNILISNQYTTLSDGTQTPFFYAHQLPENTENVTVQKVTNIGGGAIPTSEYVFLRDRNYVLGNFQNVFDEQKGRYTLYYIESIDASGSVTTSLWNGEPSFHEATLEDIDFSTGWLYEDSNAYIVTASGNGWHFALPITGTYFVKGVKGTRVRVNDPTLQTAADPWFVDIENGSFSSTINNTVYNYSVTDFDLQPFSPVYPYAITSWEKALKVNRSIVKLQREWLYIDETSLVHLEIFVLDKNGDLVYIFTTDSTKEGTKYADTELVYNSEVISSWDGPGGFVSLTDFNILDSYTLRATYYYERIHFTMTDFNFNPIFNKEILDYMIPIYIVPDVISGNRAIYYLKVRDNIIYFCSQTGATGIQNLSQYNADGTPNPNTVVGMKYDGAAGSAADSFKQIYPYYAILAEITGLVPNYPEGGKETIAGAN